MTKPFNTTTAASIFRTIAKSRHSTKRFQPSKSIPSKTLQDILQTTLTSPSGFNLQPSHVLLVQSPQIKKDLSQNAMLGIGNMYRALDASILAIFISDLEPQKRIPKILELERQYQGPPPPSGYMATFEVVSSFLLGQGHAATMFKQISTDMLSPIKPMPSIDPVQAWSYKNTSLMVQTYVLAATSHGLSTCIMEGYDDRRVKQILKIPDRYGVPLMVATGFEYKEEEEEDDDDNEKSHKKEKEENNGGECAKSPRLDFEDVFFGDSFGEPLELEEKKVGEMEGKETFEDGVQSKHKSFSS